MLYLLSRSWLDAACAEEVTSVLNTSLDWESIMQSATRHGVAPLVYRTLSRIEDASAVPPEVRTTLITAYYNNIARNMLMYHELQTVLKTFKFGVAGIAVIVLKGAFLAEVVYGNSGLL
jgi:hypothetical protein